MIGMHLWENEEATLINKLKMSKMTRFPEITRSRMDFIGRLPYFKCSFRSGTSKFELQS